MSVPLLAVAGLRLIQTGAAVVDGVTLQLQRGEVLGLLGPNGAGKTSLLSCIAGLQSPGAGTVHIDGIDALANPRAARAATGVVLQSGSCPPRLTVIEVLRLFAALRGTDESIEPVLAAVGLGSRAGASVEALSGGQRQRLMLALALLGRPPLLLLDEPGSGLDPAMRSDLQSLLQALRAEGRGIVLATHDMAEAEMLCDRVVVMSAGRIVAEGSPAVLLAPLHTAAIVHLRTLQPLDVALLPGLGADLLGTEADASLRLRLTGTPEAFLASLASHLLGTDNRLLSISLGECGLQDVIASVS